MDRNLALEFVRVTEAAALASAAHMGRGDEAVADAAAVSAFKLFGRFTVRMPTASSFSNTIFSYAILILRLLLKIMKCIEKTDRPTF